MYNFITIRCRCCGSVIYNLPEKDFKKLKLLNLRCEDCIENDFNDIKMEKSPEHLKSPGVSTRLQSAV